MNHPSLICSSGVREDLIVFVVVEIGLMCIIDKNVKFH